ncbi:MAG: pyruvate dehydrogenase [Planctomycetes bacterium GWC2_45_44]|nr:MAG: pyruvate dehydrogenase [Planctomycetes bacterium GWC2_45_44]HBR19429.1 alpha-ketoacid dehydrogenase subunit beta [Phycisphaerales bacterium]
MREITYTVALREAITEEMENDKNVFLIGEDIADFGGVFGVTKGLLDKFGRNRVRQTPISEGAIIGAAVGSAMTGIRPIAEIMYVDFITFGIDQMVNQAAKLGYMSAGAVKVPLVVRAQQGCGTCEAAQHSQQLEAWFMHTPGLKVAMPSDAYDAKGLLKIAIRDDNPVVFLEHRLLYATKQNVPDETWTVPFGKAAIKRKGKEITVVATSFCVHKALAAAEKLSGKIDVEVIDPRTLVPLDIDTITESVKKTGRLLVVHESVTQCGVGAEIVRQVMEKCFRSLKSVPKVLGGASIPMPFSRVLEEKAIPQELDIIETVEKMIKE